MRNFLPIKLFNDIDLNNVFNVYYYYFNNQNQLRIRIATKKYNLIFYKYEREHRKVSELNIASAQCLIMKCLNILY